jgi:hypothetical protein
VATQDTVTQLVAAMRRVARVVAGAAQVIAAVCTLDYRNAGKPDIDWDDPAAKRVLVSDLVNDALAVLEQLTGRQAPQRDQAAADALGLLALVAGQDVEPAQGSDGTDGRWVIARRVAPDRVISTVDPQARHTRKSRSNRRDGYRGHLATEPDTGLITDCEMTMTTGQANTDAAVGVKMAGRDRFNPTDTADTEDDDAIDTIVDAEDTTDVDAAATADADTVVSTANTADTDTEDAGDADSGDADTAAGLEIYGDSAYGTGEARAAYRDDGHDVVIKPKPLPSAVPGGFTLDDFIIDEPTGTVTCPNGNTRPMSPARTVTFGRLCDGCPLRQQCTTSKSGRSMSIHEHEGLLRAARAQAKTPQFKRDYPTRSNVERTVAQVATQNGRRVKLRHIGTATNDAWLHTRCAALNLRTLLKAGLTRRDGAWALT